MKEITTPVGNGPFLVPLRFLQKCFGILRKPRAQILVEDDACHIALVLHYRFAPLRTSPGRVCERVDVCERWVALLLVHAVARFVDEALQDVETASGAPLVNRYVEELRLDKFAIPRPPLFLLLSIIPDVEENRRPLPDDLRVPARRRRNVIQRWQLLLLFAHLRDHPLKEIAMLLRAHLDLHVSRADVGIGFYVFEEQLFDCLVHFWRLCT